MLIKRDILYTPDGTPRTLHIHLPRDYFTSGEQYPVMYFFDGHNLYRDEDATYGRSWRLEDFLERWPKPMIVVGMECSHAGNRRLDEYSPYTFTNAVLGHVQGIGEQTMDWIVSEIKPLIDREYRTFYFREATGIAGSSMGGLMSLYGAIRYNRWFSKAACLSSSVVPCAEQLQRDIVRSSLDPDTRVYLSWGTAEASDPKLSPRYELLMAQKNRELADSLEAKGVQTSLFRQENGRHCEADWEKQLPRFLDYLWF